MKIWDSFNEEASHITALVSATISTSVKRLAKKILKETFKHVNINPGLTINPAIEHKVYHREGMSENDRINILLPLLLTSAGEKTIIFADNQAQVDKIVAILDSLQDSPIGATSVSFEMSPKNGIASIASLELGNRLNSLRDSK